MSRKVSDQIERITKNLTELTGQMESVMSLTERAATLRERSAVIDLLVELDKLYRACSCEVCFEVAEVLDSVVQGVADAVHLEADHGVSKFVQED